MFLSFLAEGGGGGEEFLFIYLFPLSIHAGIINEAWELNGYETRKMPRTLFEYLRLIRLNVGKIRLSTYKLASSRTLQLKDHPFSSVIFSPLSTDKYR